jgi:nucleoid-associated protein YgaU
MKRIRTQLILALVGLIVAIVCTGCEPTIIRVPESTAAPEPVAASSPVAAPEPPQPVITEPKVAPTPEPPSPTPSPKVKLPPGPYFVRTVKWRGESLSTIAAWYTGTTRNWRTLAEANPQVTDPNRIPIGDKVRIPAKMLRTREPMPQGFVESYMKPPK